MKNTYFIVLLIIPMLGFAQYPDDDEPIIEPKEPVNFHVKDQTIFWQKVFNGSPKNINHPKLLENKGTNCNVGKCKGGSIFMQEDFSFSYKIESKEKRYRITAYNIRFENSIQLNFGTVFSDKDANNLEFFMLRDRDGKLRKNKTALRNLTCLDAYLTAMFSPKEPTKIDDW